MNPSPATVLIVDDVEVNRLVLERHLRRLGHHVVGAADGHRALALLRSQPVDLVLLDLMMPLIGGFETLVAIKSNPLLAAIPVVMVSAMDEAEQVARCIGAGADDFLLKPVDRMLLEARVRSCLERKRLYESVTAAQLAAETAARAKGAFLAAVSHELRTPLNTVIGYSEVLSAELHRRGLSDLAADLEPVSAAGHQLLGLVDDIIALVRAEAGLATLQVAPVDVAGLLVSLVASVRPQAARNRNELALDCPNEIGVITTDVEKLRQILLHLLVNACKFTEGGRVLLAAGRLADGGVRFSVVDTGIGMSNEQIAGLFALFEQGDGSTTRRYGGTGIGLALSQRLSTLLGATLSVRSCPGAGSTFELSLPVAAQAGAAALTSAA